MSDHFEDVSESFLNLSMNPSAFGSVCTVPSSFMPGLISSSISQIASRCSAILFPGSEREWMVSLL